MAASLNPRQLDLLRRIVDGYHASPEQAATVYALRSRGLVTTRSALGYSSAVTTEAGRQLTATGKAPTLTSARAGQADERERDLPTSPADLLTLLTDTRGPLVVTDPPETTRAAWRRLLHATRTEQSASSDQIIRHRGRRSGDLTIWLETRQPEVSSVSEPATIAIPERVRKPHRLVAGLTTAKAGRDGWIDTRRRDGIVHVRIHRDSRTRAIRLLHALVTEAHRRGHDIDAATGSRCAGGLAIVINGHSLEVTMLEESQRVPHVLTVAEQRNHDRGYRWGIPKWDRPPSGRLVLRHGHDSYGGNLAADRKRWTLDDKLPDVFQRLEEFAVEAEHRRLELLRRAEEREQRRRAELAAAEERRVHQLRVDHLDGQVERWKQAATIREFVTAATAFRNGPATEWLSWVAGHADAIDPLVIGVGPPDTPASLPRW